MSGLRAIQRHRGSRDVARFSKQTIGYRKVIGSPKVLRDLEFEKCYFEGGALAQFDDLSCGFVVTNSIRVSVVGERNDVD
jgi:hypothetical protein